MRRRRMLLAMSAMWGAAVLRGQAPAPSVPQPGGVFGGMVQNVSPSPQSNMPMGVVTGTVIAQDTRKPLRFATVSLVRADTGDGSRWASGTSGMDGAFGIRVMVGDYYIIAAAPGYVSAGDALRAQIAAGADAAALMAALPVVHVTAEGASGVTVTTMPRGGVISGHVEWEDGSPASGVTMHARATKDAPGMPAAIQRMSVRVDELSRTDDRGNFRISGLAAGEYVVAATTQTAPVVGTGGLIGGLTRALSTRSLQVYAPGVFHKTAAKTFIVREGEERSDARIVIDPRGLHTVAGHASSAEETVRRGSVALTDVADSSIHISAQIDAEGGFQVRYVPPGTYTLQVSGANSQPPPVFRGGRSNGEQQPAGVAYQDFSTTITVGETDVSGVAVSLVPKASAK